MKMFPSSLKGLADYTGYAVGLIIGYGILSPLFMTVEDSLRKGE
jgi:hypothetical protein